MSAPRRPLEGAGTLIGSRPTPEELVDTIAAHGLDANVNVLGDAFLVGIARSR
jgi:hypothetical protein